MYVHTQWKHLIVMHVVKCLTPVNFFQRTKKTEEHRKNTKQTECQGCEHKFHGKYEAKRHFDSSCYFNPERNVKCTICNIVTGKAKHFLEHLKEEHNTYKTQILTKHEWSTPKWWRSFPTLRKRNRRMHHFFFRSWLCIKCEKPDQIPCYITITSTMISTITIFGC